MNHALCEGADIPLCRQCARLDTQPENRAAHATPHHPRIPVRNEGTRCREWKPLAWPKSHPTEIR